MKMGKIYFLRRADGRIKIGFTTNLKSRLVSQWIDGETCFPCWAETPEEALRQAFAWAYKGDAEIAERQTQIAKDMRREAFSAASE